MPDEMDLAQEINDQFQEAALAEHLRHRQSGPSATHCDDCGEEIPIKRRVAVPGCHRCIDCQKEHEIVLANWRAL